MLPEWQKSENRAVEALNAMAAKLFTRAACGVALYRFSGDEAGLEAAREGALWVYEDRRCPAALILYPDGAVCQKQSLPFGRAFEILVKPTGDAHLIQSARYRSQPCRLVSYFYGDTRTLRASFERSDAAAFSHPRLISPFTPERAEALREVVLENARRVKEGPARRAVTAQRLLCGFVGAKCR